MSDQELTYDEDKALEQGRKAPSWMVMLSEHCQAWLKALPEVKIH
jgi:hypothetical protein